MEGYYCEECGLAVIILPDKTILRPCGHTGTIIAGMSATATGIAKELKVDNAVQEH
jgi:hypothetical protein